MLTVCMAACTPPSGSPYPFALSEVTIDPPERRVSLALTCDRRKLPWDKDSIGLLCVYCFKPEFDIQVIGRFDGEGAGFPDPSFGGDVAFSTIINPKSENPYLGAWWLGSLDTDQITRDHLTMTLFLSNQFGYLAGKGYLHCAIVQGPIGRTPFTLLSEPVVIPYDTGWHPDHPMAELEQEKPETPPPA